MALSDTLSELIKHSIKSKNQKAVDAYRNIKTDFDYKKSKNPILTDTKIILALYKERTENAILYETADREDLASVESYEAGLLFPYCPIIPSDEEVIEFLSGIGLVKEKRNFKQFRDMAEEHFNVPIDSKLILNWINS